MASELHQNLNSLFIDQSLAAISEGQFQLLVEALGVQTLWRLQQESLEPTSPSLEVLLKWHRVALLTDRIQLIGFETMTARGMAALVKAHGLDLIANLVGGARSERDPGAKRRLAAMISGNAGHGAENGDSGSVAAAQAEPVDQHASDPRSAPHRFEQMAPPPGRQTRAVVEDGHEETTVAHAPNQARPQRTEAASSGGAPNGDRYRPTDQRSHGRQDSPQRRPGNVHQMPVRAEASNRHAPDDSAGGDRKPFDQQNVYSKGASGSSVRFQASEDKRGEGRFVVFVECAHINSDGSTYNWNDKLSLMLNTAETERAILVLMNKLPLARFSAHGFDKKKWMQILSQAPTGRYSGCKQVTAGDGQRKFLCNMSPIDQSKMLAVLQRAYAKMIDLPIDTAMSNLDAIAENYRLEYERTPELVEIVRRSTETSPGNGNGQGQRGQGGGSRNADQGAQRYGSHRG